ncbi:hypothetical protein TeGR_g9261 [Tetraparma gracilis]|uniref:Histone-lysine N-methyltransferase, H3 lysine-79 specific n=1 Tax=Tetraparma gracilis TaxID=2962635 RepID=A0ABQ6MT88_9STRA|nr:hypothetical protein TeGR_g9261 [Tetraparma gracilis]
MESSVLLALAGGVGSAEGGAAVGSKARLVGRAGRKPSCVAEAESRAAARLQLAARARAERGDEPAPDKQVRAIAEGVFAAATRKYPLSIGKAVSKRERDERARDEGSLAGPSYNYSEASFEAVHHAVHRVRSALGKPGRGSSPPEGVLQGEVLTELGAVAGGGSFYDLGAGTGKALIAAAATHSFSYVCGVEALEGLHNASLELLAGYEARHRRKLEPAMLEFAVSEQEIDVRQGDFTEDDCADWVTGDVVFANCTCYDDELMGKIAEMAEGMRQGTFFVSVTRALESDAFELVDSAVLPVS